MMAYTSGISASTSATSTTITPPAGIVSGELVVLFISKDGTGGFNTPSGWVLLGGKASTGTYLSVYYKFATGEIAPFDITHAAEATSWICFNFPMADIPVISDGVAGTSNSPNSDALTSGFPENTSTLWFSVCGWDYNRSLSSYPSDCPDNRVTTRYSSTSGCGIAVASKTSTNASEDPSNFVISASDEWSAFTVGIRFMKYELSGTFISQAIDTSLYTEDYLIKFNTVTPADTSLQIAYACSSDNVSAPESGWTIVNSGDPVVIDDHYLWIKATLETIDDTITPVLSDLWIEESEPDAKKVQVNLTYLGRMKHPQGNVVINFTGSLIGPNNSQVAPFVQEFLPEDLTLWFKPNDPERIVMTGVVAVANLVQVFYISKTTPNENIAMTNVVASGVLTHIDDIET